MDLRFGTWNVMSICKSWSLETSAVDWARNELDLLGGQVNTWDKTSTEIPDDSLMIAHAVI